MVSEEFIIDFTGRIKAISEKIEPSFFEITVAMAFEYFAEQKIDIAIIETGLGGRFDSTNIITPELSVITNIGWDHMNILGESLEKIAFEKAGIIKQNIPVIIGEVLSETEEVFNEVANERKAALSIASDKRQAINWHWKKRELIVEVAQQHKTNHQLYHLDLPGIYQTKNLNSFRDLPHLQQKGWNIEEQSIRLGLQHTKKLTGLHGRWEVIHMHPLIVLDVAHNEDGIKMLMEQVEVTDHDHLHIVLGVVKDKELEKILTLFPRLADYYFTRADIPRALDALVLKERANEIGLKGEIYPDVNQAIKAALTKASKQDMILVCGSVFLIGEVTPHLTLVVRANIAIINNTYFSLNEFHLYVTINAKANFLWHIIDAVKSISFKNKILYYEKDHVGISFSICDNSCVENFSAGNPEGYVLLLSFIKCLL
jgi:dihydrofolate synthase/folylpolyglutamate synthase